jgi:hypothetical protein
LETSYRTPTRRTHVSGTQGNPWGASRKRFQIVGNVLQNTSQTHTRKRDPQGNPCEVSRKRFQIVASDSQNTDQTHTRKWDPQGNPWEVSRTRMQTVGSDSQSTNQTHTRKWDPRKSMGSFSDTISNSWKLLTELSLSISIPSQVELKLQEASHGNLTFDFRLFVVFPSRL